MEKKVDWLLLFLKAFSSEINLLVTLIDFTVKNAETMKGNLYIMKIDLVEMK